MNTSLICNHTNCFKELSHSGWATICSHIFCDEHGMDLSSKGACIACGTKLPDKNYVIHVNLSPSKYYKAMALVGQNPQTILESAQKALDFWEYQRNQENLLLRKKVSYYKELAADNQESLEKCKKKLSNEITALKQDLEISEAKRKQLQLELLETNDRRKRNEREYIQSNILFSPYKKSD